MDEDENFIIDGEAAEKRISELSAIFKRLYEDSVTGRISDERFTELSANYEAEQKELKEKTAALQTELSKAQEATVNAEKFMGIVRKYTNIEELTPTLLRELVEKIVIHEAEPLDGKCHGKLRRQNIDIYYSFVGKVDLPTARPVRRNAQTPDRNGKIFYTSVTSLSHIRKNHKELNSLWLVQVYLL